MANFECGSMSPDMFQQQMVGSFCSLVNGQLLLAECLAETSDSIKKSVTELSTLVEQSRREILDEINGLKNLIEKSSATQPSDVVAVPVSVQEMLTKLEAVTSKMSNFKPRRIESSSHNCPNNSPRKSTTIDSSNVSVVLNNCAEGYNNTGHCNGHQSVSKLKSQVPGKGSNLTDGIIIKSEVIKINDESESSSSTESSESSDDVDVDVVGRRGLTQRKGIRCSPRKFQGKWPRGRPAGMIQTSRYPLRVMNKKPTVIHVNSSSSSSDESHSSRERIKPSPAKTRKTR